MQRTSDVSARLWVIQAVSGVLLIGVLGLHMVAQHFIAEGGLRNYHDVISYIANPLVFSIEVLFLIVVTIHAMLGVRAILMDLGPGEKLRQGINWALLGAGLIIVGYGIWLAGRLQSLV